MTRTRTGTGTWTTGVTAIALCTSCSRAKNENFIEKKFKSSRGGSNDIHVISTYFWRDLPYILEQISLFGISEFPYILYISNFRILDLPTKNQEFSSLFNHSPYLERQISLFGFPDVSHVCLMSTHNLCFRAKIGMPLHSPVLQHESGVFISRLYLPDGIT